MSMLKFKKPDGTWESVAAIKGENGKDGAIQYQAGDGIKIEDNVISTNVSDNKIGPFYVFTYDSDDTFMENYSYTLKLSAEKTQELMDIINDYKANYNRTDKDYLNLSGFSLYFRCRNNNIGWFFTQNRTSSSDGTLYLYSTQAVDSGEYPGGAKLEISCRWRGSGADGRVYQILSVKLTTYNCSNVIKGAFLAKTNTTAYTPTKDYHPATKKYVDDNKSQVDTLPEASADNLGKILQYTGETTEELTNGYFYQVIGETTTDDAGTETTTYSWAPVSVQNGSSGNKYLYEFDLMRDGRPLNTDISLNDDEKERLRMVLNQILVDGENAISTHTLLLHNSLWPGRLVYLTPYYNSNLSDMEAKTSYQYLQYYGILITSALPNDFKYEQFQLNVTYISTAGKEIESIYISTIKWSYGRFIGTNNTYAFTPTGDYNPATKKYVDDAITTAITTALESDY